MTVLSIYLNGDKNSFFSKSALLKFKSIIKDNPSNYNKICYNYMKPEYKLELIEQNEFEIKFDIIKLENIIKPQNNRELLISKIKKLKSNRTNLKSTNNKDVDNNLIKEYNDLKKISKIPIPNPNEVLADPKKYKDIIELFLNDDFIKKMGVTHPYIKYHKSLYTKINKILSEKNNHDDNNDNDNDNELDNNKLNNNELDNNKLNNNEFDNDTLNNISIINTNLIETNINKNNDTESEEEDLYFYNENKLDNDINNLNEYNLIKNNSLSSRFSFENCTEIDTESEYESE
jgi:hypothetical protein